VSSHCSPQPQCHALLGRSIDRSSPRRWSPAAQEAEEEKVDEEFEEVAYEGDDEMSPMGGDPTDDLEGEMGPEEDGDLADESEEELFQDLDSIVDELQARFDKLGGGEEAGADMGDEMGDDEMGDKEPEELFQDLDAIVDELQAKFDAMNGDDMGDDMGPPDEMKDDFDLATVREYVEKVPGGHGAEKKGQGEGQYSGTGKLSDSTNVNSKSIVAGKNDMGGTTANILSSKEDAPKYAGAGGGQLGGSSLFKGTPKEDNAGNINVPGGKAGGAFSKKEPGHGAEKKGEAEGKFSGAGGSSGSVDKASLFRGRR
jgi:hypothetical protein